ncbi:hypothetical protein [Bordetella petrii]|uniref:hypothetical protein n=1 Tax=Bordetella petrii TaxID=94624 RepID=UPI0005A4907A|nr:hypothetical protein [Bordetella petrii]
MNRFPSEFQRPIELLLISADIFGRLPLSVDAVAEYFTAIGSTDIEALSRAIRHAIRHDSTFPLPWRIRELLDTGSVNAVVGRQGTS